jgi:hypothetical protein
MMDLETAPLPPASTAKDSYEGYERHIGATIAALAAALALAVWQYQDGKPTRATTRRGGELMAELVQFKMALPEFDAIARREGKAEFRKHCESNLMELDGGWLDQLVEETLALLSNFLKAKTN